MENSLLLLLRFHKLQPTLSKRRKQTSVHLLHNLYNMLNSNNIERRRLGGSSGFTNYRRLKSLIMTQRNSSPRLCKATIFLKSKNNLKWHVIYIGTKDNSAKYTYYTNPQLGGSFVMDTEYFKKYPFLVKFASTKPIAALICEQLNQQSSTNPLLPKGKISPSSVRNELHFLMCTKQFLSEYNNEDSGK